MRSLQEVQVKQIEKVLKTKQAKVTDKIVLYKGVLAIDNIVIGVISA